MKRALLAAALAGLSIAGLGTLACEATPTASPAGGASGDGAAPTTDFTFTVLRLRAGADPSTLTVALPFAAGELRDAGALQLFAGARELPRNTKVLARWPDGSARSVLVGFSPPSALGAGSPIGVKKRGAPPQLLPGDPLAERTPTLRAFASAERWASTRALGYAFARAEAGASAPAFFRRAAPVFQSTSNPPGGSDAEPHVRNYYDHTHALYMHMLAVGPSATFVERIDAEVAEYREREIVQAGARRGTYSAGQDTETTTPLDFNIVRRMYAQGLVEDYLFTGDARSLEIARSIADAFLADIGPQTPFYTHTERIPAWTILGLLPVYEATGDARYLDGAKTVANVAVRHQRAMAAKYPNQAGVAGLTGAFVQDKRGAWFDVDESSASGAGSPFMTTLLVEALVRLYDDTKDTAFLDAATKAAKWLREGCAVKASDGSTVFTDDPDPASSDDGSMHHATFRYVCRASDNRTALPALNPMFAFTLGVGWQRTGEEAYRTLARDVLAYEGWGYTIKEYNQSLRSASQGLFLLEEPAGSVYPKP
jgi:hypothetical protein